MGVTLICSAVFPFTTSPCRLMTICFTVQVYQFFQRREYPMRIQILFDCRTWCLFDSPGHMHSFIHDSIHHDSIHSFMTAFIMTAIIHDRGYGWYSAIRLVLHIASWCLFASHLDEHLLQFPPLQHHTDHAATVASYIPSTIDLTIQHCSTRYQCCVTWM